MKGPCEGLYTDVGLGPRLRDSSPRLEETTTRDCLCDRPCTILPFPHFEYEIRVTVQSSEKRLVRGLVKFVPALACLFCLALLGTCLVESAYLISEPCSIVAVLL